MKNKSVFVMILLVLGLSNAWAATNSGHIIVGEQKAYGGAPVWTWVQLNSDRSLRSIGATFDGSFLSKLPDESFEIALQFPRQGLTKPFRHFAINWEPHGHDPASIYGSPHFDFHFYLISIGQRKKITCTGADEARCLQVIPTGGTAPGYVPTPAGVPQMGWHWVDSQSSEFQGQPFTTTMVQGYYKGRMIFLEPMMTLDFLNSKPNFQAEIKQPSIYPEAGFYPTLYKVLYRSVEDEFDIVLTDMVFRK